MYNDSKKANKKTIVNMNDMVSGGINMNKTNTKVFCRRNENETLNFYIEMNMRGEKKIAYLFTTSYGSKNIEAEYKNGKRLNQIFENTRKFRQQKLRDRIIKMISFIEDEYDIRLTNKNNFKSYNTIEKIDYKFKKDNSAAETA